MPGQALLGKPPSRYPRKDQGIKKGRGTPAFNFSRLYTFFAGYKKVFSFWRYIIWIIRIERRTHDVNMFK